jgi:MFS transporter, DHA2 family, multidrug resistance protein
VFQTLALPFLFVPITSAAYGGLPPDKTDEASSLINVARNLGGSIGIAATTTMLARAAQVHQNYLSGQFTPSSAAYQQAASALTETLVGHGMTPAAAPAAAIALMGRKLAQQVSMLAYMDVFTMLSAAGLVMAVLALILMRKPAGNAGASSR